MRPLCSALTKSGFELVHRSSRYSSSRFVIQDPHLITSGTSCVFYFKLIDLIGNAVRDEAPDSTALSRQESIFTTLRRFSSLYDHILVVLEEAQGSRKSATSLKPASYTPPVLEGLSRLAPALAQLSEVSQGKVKIHVACSSGPEFSAETTRKFTNHVEREDEREARPGVVAWGERGWLTVDPQRVSFPLSISLLMVSIAKFLVKIARIISTPAIAATKRSQCLCDSLDRLERSVRDPFSRGTPLFLR
jgi:hypothetical protein